MQPYAFLTKKRNPTLHTKTCQTRCRTSSTPLTASDPQCMPTSPPHPNKPRDRALLRKQYKSNAPPPACLSARPPAFALWPDDVSKKDAVRVARPLYLWQVLAPQCMSKTLQLTAIGAEASNTNAGRSAALTSPQGSVAAASPRRGWPDDCDSRDVEYLWGLLRRDCGRREADDANERVTVRRSYNVENNRLSHSPWTTVLRSCRYPGERVARAGSLHEQRLRHWLRVPSAREACQMQR